ncbi:MAG: hypothetical protein ABDH59_03825 [Fervidobacterium sp.]
MRKIMPISLILLSTFLSSAIIRLTSGMEAKVKVVKLAEKAVIVQAEGFNQPVQFDPKKLIKY